METSILRKLISKHEISVSDLAKKVGVPKSTINSWLQGVSPNIDQLNKVAEFFQVSLDYLAFGKEVTDPLDTLLEKIEVHTGTYEVTIKKIKKK